MDNANVQSKKEEEGDDEFGIRNLEDADNEYHINFVNVNENLHGEDMLNFVVTIWSVTLSKILFFILFSYIAIISLSTRPFQVLAWI